MSEVTTAYYYDDDEETENITKVGDKDKSLLDFFIDQERIGYSRGHMVCSGAFVSKDSILFFPERPCHGFMGGISKYRFHDGALVSGTATHVCTSISLGEDYDYDEDDEDDDYDDSAITIKDAEEWWKFLLDKDRSPFRIGGDIVYNGKRPVYASIPVNADIKATHLVGLLIATRQTIENPGHVKLWIKARNEGFNDLEAFAIASFGGLYGGDDSATVNSISHPHFPFAPSGATWGLIRDRKPNFDGKRFGVSYGRIYSLFVQDLNLMCRDKYFKGVNKGRPKKYEGPFLQRLRAAGLIDHNGLESLGGGYSRSYDWKEALKVLKENRSELFPDN
jgi:hypothetical protein